jgi:hypothetical protein
MNFGSKRDELIKKLDLGTSAPRSVPDFLSGSFEQQKKFITDTSRLKWARCTRRAAKSYSVGLDLMRTAYFREGSCLYIGLTRESAKRIMWKDVLKTINRKHGAGFRFYEQSLVAESPIGSPIYLIGVDSNEEEKQKALGQKFRKVYIDEAQSFTIDLRELVYQILKPAIADYRGTIGLTGTPGNLVRGFFYDLTTGKEPGWSGHQWTAYDNPYIARQWDEEIKGLIASNPLVVETPWFRQMYLNQWVIESDKLVYRYNPERNAFKELPSYVRGDWHHVLGVDLGHDDATALVVCAWHDYDKTLYIREVKKKSGLDITDTVNEIRYFQGQYDLDAIIIDGSNKQAVEEMRRRHNLPLTAADKTGKADFIELMNGEFIQGQIKIHGECTPLIDEYLGLIWHDKGLRREEHPSCPNHLCDATLYAWRYCYQYLSDSLPGEPTEAERIEQMVYDQWRQQRDELGIYSEGISEWDPLRQ